MQPKAAIWFHCMGWLLNTRAQMSVKTVSEMHSWMILSCIRLNGPPLMSEPILLAGTMKLYSRNATPHETRMIRISGHPSEMCISESLSWPYQAKVMKMLDTIRRSIVPSPCMVVSIISRRKHTNFLSTGRIIL